MTNNITEQLKPLAIKINSVSEDPQNARIGHDIDGIAESLKRFGQRKPVIVNKNTMTIEAGNGTWKAAKKLGWSEIAAVMVDDDKNTHSGFAIADNRLSDSSVFDALTLENILLEIDVLPPGVDSDFLEQMGINLSGDEIIFSDKKNDGLKIKSGQTIKMAVFYEDIKTIERALIETGEKNRGLALKIICEEFLEKRQFDIDL